MKKSPLLILFITILIDMLGFGIIIPILPIFTKELGAANYLVGLIAMSYPLMNFLFAPFWGSLSDRFGRRPIILTSVLITALAYTTFGLSVNLWVLLFSRILGGIGAANFSVAQAYIADVTRPEQRTKSMGIMGAAFGMGLIIGPTVGGYLKSISTLGRVDWVGFAAAGLSILNFILAYFLLPESLKEKQIQKAFNFKVVTRLVNELKKPAIRELLWINFIYTSAFMITQISASLFWKEKIQLNEIGIGNMFAFIGLATAVVQGLLIGKMVKAFGETNLLLYGIIIVIISFAAVPWVTQSSFIPWELVAFALLALGNGCITPTVISLLSKASDPKEVGQVLGVNQSFSSMARAVGMGMSGLFYGIDFHSPFLISSVMMVGCLALYTWANKSKA